MEAALPLGTNRTSQSDFWQPLSYRLFKLNIDTFWIETTNQSGLTAAMRNYDKLCRAE
ncbi:conserved hypothetical protein [Ricinus communis]|uniref:Uncharacterized protein n=1 Tax=Ricinus communis TaxID=3988 RepID=B9RQC3_RICCO|nr:conserved hypothetical protein [Ricinus communis]